MPRPTDTPRYAGSGHGRGQRTKFDGAIAMRPGLSQNGPMSPKREAGVVGEIARRALKVVAALLAVLAIGTIGYRAIGGPAFAWFDCFYMTVITVTTIGYGEILDFSAHPGGRIFTVAVAFFGISVATYAISTVTSLAVDGRLKNYWRKRAMDRAIEKLSSHYLLCGWGGTAAHVARELASTNRPFVLIAPTEAPVRLLDGRDPEWALQGDPTDDELLQQAGIARAAGVFCVSDDDPTNIVLCVSARRLNPAVRIVSAVNDPRHAEKMKRAGADATVSAQKIGGLRIASEMIRPVTVSFLDTMLRDANHPLRVEEIRIGSSVSGKNLSELNVNEPGRALVVALKTPDGWVFHPEPGRMVKENDTLIVMATPDRRTELERRCGG